MADEIGKKELEEKMPEGGLNEWAQRIGASLEQKDAPNPEQIPVAVNKEVIENIKLWGNIYWQPGMSENTEAGGFLIGRVFYDSKFRPNIIVEKAILDDEARKTAGSYSPSAPGINLAREEVSQLNKIKIEKEKGMSEHRIIGTWHTHPPGWERQITGKQQDRAFFADRAIFGSPLQENVHIVYTPASDTIVFYQVEEVKPDGIFQVASEISRGEGYWEFSI